MIKAVEKFPRMGLATLLLVGSLSLAFILVLVLSFGFGMVVSCPDSIATDTQQAAPSSSRSSAPAPSTRDSTQHSITINRPTSPPQVDTGVPDSHGQPVMVSCQTCHATRVANFENRTPNDLDEFHRGLEFTHGSVSCLSCHNSDNYDSLKLADQSRVEFVDVMTLCSQCHGTQRRDYDHGAHGGMNGYWDLTKGPRIRNNCVDCHAPHVPGFPKMQPTFKPHDRFLTPAESEADSHVR